MFRIEEKENKNNNKTITLYSDVANIVNLSLPLSLYIYIYIYTLNQSIIDSYRVKKQFQL